MEARSFYQKAIGEYQSELSRLKKLSLFLSMLRLVVFFGIIFARRFDRNLKTEQRNYVD